MFELPPPSTQHAATCSAQVQRWPGQAFACGRSGQAALAQQIGAFRGAVCTRGQLRKSWRAPRRPSCPDPGPKRFVDNKAGAAGNIAMSEVARAEDQHTLILGHIRHWRSIPSSSTSCLRCQQGLQTREPVGPRCPNLHVVHPDVPVRTSRNSSPTPEKPRQVQLQLCGQWQRGAPGV